MMDHAFDISENRFVRGSVVYADTMQRRNRPGSVGCRPAVTLPRVFSDNMVLQEGTSVPIGMGPGRRHGYRPISEGDGFNPR